MDVHYKLSDCSIQEYDIFELPYINLKSRNHGSTSAIDRDADPRFRHFNWLDNFMYLNIDTLCDIIRDVHRASKLGAFI